MILLYESIGENIKLTMEILNYIILAIDIFLLLFLSWFYIIYFINSFRKTKEMKLCEPKNRFAVLIPARNESDVIRNILNSLKNQNYPKKLFDIYVIVEDILDPTVKILDEYGHRFNLVVRDNLDGRRTKGYALDDAYQQIKRNGKKYNAYVIFDADNVVSSNYLLTMNAIKEKGYQIGMGYRNFTNASTNCISMSSAILFSFINAFLNNGKSTYFKKAALTGTGYFIDSKIVDDAGGWIWNGMTEDVELTYYAYKNHIKMKYYPKISYFDEQPTLYKVMHCQHVRWVRGYLVNFKKKFADYNFDYTPNEDKNRRNFSKLEQKISIYPFITFVILELVIFLTDISLGITCISLGLERYITINAFLFAIYHLFIFYITFILIAFYTVLLDHHNLKFSIKDYVKGILSFPFFFFDFLLAFFDGLIHKKKRKDWKIIRHEGKVIDEQAVISQGGK